MGIYDRDWHKQERREQREREGMGKAKRPTPPGWNVQEEDLEPKKMIMMLSISLNIVLGAAIIYMATV